MVWADGTPVPGAWVCVAYDKTDDYDALAGTHCTPDADQHGSIEIRTYGQSQVRVFAQQYVFGGDGAREPGTYRSQQILYAADQIPDAATFVLGYANRQ